MVTVHPNAAGIARLLASREVQEAAMRLGEQVADRVRVQGVEVEGIPGDIPLPVKVYASDRGDTVAAVVLAHPASLAVQAKDGVLSKAAAECGLEVNG